MGGLNPSAGFRDYISVRNSLDRWSPAGTRLEILGKLNYLANYDLQPYL